MYNICTESYYHNIFTHQQFWLNNSDNLDSDQHGSVTIGRGVALLESGSMQQQYNYLCTYYAPVKWHSPIGSMPFHRAQKTREFQGPTPSHFPS
jgi:hypothetical protein